MILKIDLFLDIERINLYVKVLFIYNKNLNIYDQINNSFWLRITFCLNLYNIIL